MSHHRLIVDKILATLDFLDETIEDLSTEIDRLIAPFVAEVELMDTITGVDRRAAERIIAEIGVDMARFGSSARRPAGRGYARAIVNLPVNINPGGDQMVAPNTPSTREGQPI